MGKRTNSAVWLEKYNRWQIKVQKDNIRKTFTSSAPGKRGQIECNSKADQWLDDNIENNNTRVSKLFEQYFEQIKITNGKSGQIKIDSIYRNWINPNIGNLKISKITENHLQNIILKAYKKGLSKKSLQNIRAILVSFIKFCRKEKVTNLYIEDLTIPKNAISKTKKILQPKDIKILLSSEKTIIREKEVFDKNINAYRFLVFTGLRPGELMGLKWKDINNNIVNIKRSKNYINEFTKGKNKNAIRKFALNNITEKILNDQKKLNTDEFVFGELNLSTLSKRWKIYCEYNNICYVSLYELRHTFVSYIKELSIDEIKPIIGHSESMDTVKTYGHEVNGELINTSKEIENKFKLLVSDINLFTEK